MEPVTKEMFDEWMTLPVTKKVFNTLKQEREVLKEGLVYNNYEAEAEVKGMCRAIANFLTIEYEELNGNPSKQP